MPPEVAAIHLSGGAAMLLHDCEDCGFRTPVTPGEYKGKPAVHHFDSCPLCGGRIGYDAHFKEKKSEAASVGGHTIR